MNPSLAVGSGSGRNEIIFTLVLYYESLLLLYTFKENYQDILRIAHSIQERKVEASTIFSKLGSYARKNNLE